MSSVYAKSGRLYFSLKIDGRWVKVRTEFQVGQEPQAEAMLERIEAQQAAGEAPTLGPPTVAAQAARWLKERERTVKTWKNDESVMRLHVLPVIGTLRLDQVRPKHLADMVKGWRARGALAPRSIYTAYSTASAFFRDAAIEDLIASSPCMLTKRQLGPKVDANPEWRRTALFGRGELETLISDNRVPFDRRVFYALEGIAGLRCGEASGLVWRNAMTPVPEHQGSLDMLFVAFSYEHERPKGDVCRPVPVHPTLAAVLAEWKLSGWESFMGRKPGPDDLVVPLPPEAVSKRGRWRRRQWVRKQLKSDLELLGLRHRRGHDLRRGFISMTRAAGARSDILRRVTHKPPTEVIDGYTTFEWPIVCAEVRKLPVKLGSGPKVLPLRAVGWENPSHDFQPAAVFRGKRAVALPGLEPGRSPTAPTSDQQRGEGATAVESGASGRATRGAAADQQRSTEASGGKVGNALDEAARRWRERADRRALVGELLDLLRLLEDQR